MATYEVSRRLVKSPPELWEELDAERLSGALGAVRVETTEPERAIAWEAEGVRGTAVIEPTGWGTKLTLTAEVEEQVADAGTWSRPRREDPPPPAHPDLEQKLEALLDDLGGAHKQPFSR